MFSQDFRISWHYNIFLVKKQLVYIDVFEVYSICSRLNHFDSIVPGNWWFILHSIMYSTMRNIQSIYCDSKQRNYMLHFGLPSNKKNSILQFHIHTAACQSQSSGKNIQRVSDNKQNIKYIYEKQSKSYLNVP